MNRALQVKTIIDPSNYVIRLHNIPRFRHSTAIAKLFVSIQSSLPISNSTSSNSALGDNNNDTNPHYEIPNQYMANSNNDNDDDYQQGVSVKIYGRQ
jgi:hypothetical protein